MVPVPSFGVAEVLLIVGVIGVGLLALAALGVAIWWVSRNKG